MAITIKPWQDGGNLTATYEGSGDGSIIFTSDFYEGIDREMTIIVRSTNTSVNRTVRQEGIRQKITLADGLVFKTTAGERFGVIKQQ